MTSDENPDNILTEEDGADLFSPKEIKNMISEKLNPKRILGHDQVTACIFQALPNKGLVTLT